MNDLFHFMESISQQFLSSPYSALRNSEIIIKSCSTTSTTLELQTDEHSTQLHRLDLSTSNTAACDKEVAFQAAGINNHSHIGCSDNFSCRLKVPCPIVSESHFIPNTQMVA